MRESTTHATHRARKQHSLKLKRPKIPFDGVWVEAADLAAEVLQALGVFHEAACVMSAAEFSRDGHTRTLKRPQTPSNGVGSKHFWLYIERIRHFSTLYRGHKTRFDTI